VRTIVFVQLPLVVVLRTATLMFEPQQELKAGGVANIQFEPHSYVFETLQEPEGIAIETDCVNVLETPQGLVATQIRVWEQELFVDVLRTLTGIFDPLHGS
jgi:hypothetical protein